MTMLFTFCADATCLTRMMMITRYRHISKDLDTLFNIKLAVAKYAQINIISRIINQRIIRLYFISTQKKAESSVPVIPI